MHQTQKINSSSYPIPKFKVGDQVLRKGEVCTVRIVDHSLDPVSYTIQVNGTDRKIGTEEGYLSPVESVESSPKDNSHVQEEMNSDAESFSQSSEPNLVHESEDYEDSEEEQEEAFEDSEGAFEDSEEAFEDSEEEQEEAFEAEKRYSPSERRYSSSESSEYEEEDYEEEELCPSPRKRRRHNPSFVDPRTWWNEPARQRIDHGYRRPEQPRQRIDHGYRQPEQPRQRRAHRRLHNPQPHYRRPATDYFRPHVYAEPRRRRTPFGRHGFYEPRHQTFLPSLFSF